MKNIVLFSALCTTIAMHALDEKKNYTYVCVGEQQNDGTFLYDFHVKIDPYKARYAQSNDPIHPWDLQRLTHMVKLEIAKEKNTKQYPTGRMITENGFLQSTSSNNEILSVSQAYLFEIETNSIKDKSTQSDSE